MAIAESIQVPLPILSSKPTQIMKKYHFNNEYITEEYR